jgi:hypothetical protein
MAVNPLEGVAQDVIRKVGGPDRALAEMQRLRALGMSYADILSYWISLYP